MLSLGELGLKHCCWLALPAVLDFGLSAFYLNKGDRPMHSEQKWQMVFDSVIVPENRTVGAQHLKLFPRCN